jgi:hypothetical protein
MTGKENDMTEKSSNRDPSHLVYAVRDRGEDKDAIWTRIGASWPHKDGKGHDIQLDAAPLEGRLTLRENRREEFKARRSEQDRPQELERGDQR